MFFMLYHFFLLITHSWIAIREIDIICETPLQCPLVPLIQGTMCRQEDRLTPWAAGNAALRCKDYADTLPLTGWREAQRFPELSASTIGPIGACELRGVTTIY